MNLSEYMNAFPTKRLAENQFQYPLIQADSLMK